MSNLKKKYRLDPISYDEISLVDSGANQHADVLIFKRDGRKNDCAKPNSSTGAKETDPSKKSQRAKNWKEDRHKRDEKGRMKETSAESKEKYGKDGTTKASLERECRTGQRTKDGKKKRPTPVGQITSDPEEQREIRRRRRRRRQVEKSLTTWDKDAQVRAILERKAPHGN